MVLSHGCVLVGLQDPCGVVTWLCTALRTLCSCMANLSLSPFISSLLLVLPFLSSLLPYSSSHLLLPPSSHPAPTSSTHPGSLIRCFPQDVPWHRSLPSSTLAAMSSLNYGKLSSLTCGGGVVSHVEWEWLCPPLLVLI